MYALFKAVETVGELWQLNDICVSKGFEVVSSGDVSQTLGSAVSDLKRSNLCRHVNDTHEFGTKLPTRFIERVLRRYEILGLDQAELGLFGELSVCFLGDSWSCSVDNHIWALKRNSGRCVWSVKDADVVVLGHDMVIAPDLGQDVLFVSEETFLDVLPRDTKIRRTIKQRMGDSTKKIWNMISSRDIQAIDEGIAEAKASPSEIDILLEGCWVNTLCDLRKSKLFSGSRPSMAYTNYALLNLLSLAPTGSRAERIRANVGQLCLDLAAIPKILGFTNLSYMRVEGGDPHGVASAAEIKELSRERVTFRNSVCSPSCRSWK